MPPPTRSPWHPRRAAGALLCALLAASCTEAIGPEEHPTAGPPPPASFAVAITPDATSTTGVPLLALPDQVGASFITSAMSAINEENWVVGTARVTGDRAVVWRGGELEVIWGTSTRTTRGFGLSETGMVVGEWVGSTGASLGFRWQDGTAPALLAEPPGYALGRAEARDVDEDGNILLYYERTSFCAMGPNVLDATAVMRPPYSRASDYTSIQGPECENDISGRAVQAGVVLGHLSTRFSEATTAGAFRWTAGAAAEVIGDWIPEGLAGDYAGGSRFTGAAVVAVRWAGGGVEDLGTLGGASSNGRGVNRLGWVVGHSETAAGETHAFLWRPGEEMMDLGTLGGDFSTAADVNDQGYIVGDAENESGRRVPVVWFVDPAAAEDQPPVIEAIISQSVFVGETLEVTPVVTDAEGDPFTLSWTGDIEDNAAINGVFTWTPTADQVGGYEITVTATQNDDPTLFDSELFVVSVLAADPPASADLQVVVAPAAPQQQLLGDAVAYIASVHNAGPDAAPADLTVALEYRDQAEWGAFPPEGAINGVFFIELGELAAGQTVHVPFEVVYGAFGVQDVTATAASDVEDPAPDDNVAVFEQVIDLPLDAPGVIATGLDVGGGSTFDGEPLAVVGLHVPAALVAGRPGDLFVPAALTPQGTLIPQPDEWDPARSFIPSPDDWAARDVFIPLPDQWLPGQVFIPQPDDWLPGQVFIPEPDSWLPGQVFIPEPDFWAPAGRLLFARGATDLLVGERGSAGIGIAAGAGPGLAVDVAGGDADASLGFCAARFNALMGDADGAEFACGSLTVEVFAGPISVVLDDGTRVEIPAGTVVSITEGPGGWDVEVVEGDPAGVIVVPPATFEWVRAYLDALRGDGTLSGGQHRALVRKLDQAQKHLDDGKHAAAIEVLEDLRRQVVSLADDGVLSADQRDDLAAALTGIIADLSA